MTEENLQRLSINDLNSLLVNTINEYLGLYKYPKNRMSKEVKRFELYLLQKVITNRKARNLQKAGNPIKNQFNKYALNSTNQFEQENIPPVKAELLIMN